MRPNLAGVVAIPKQQQQQQQQQHQQQLWGQPRRYAVRNAAKDIAILAAVLFMCCSCVVHVSFMCCSCVVQLLEDPTDNEASFEFALHE
jgi:predicted RNA-binding protein with PUA-like domain